MTDLIHFYLKAAWEEVQMRERKYLDPPALVPAKPDTNGMLSDIQKERAKHPIQPKSPISTAPPKPRKTKEKRASRPRRKTASTT